ncbi:hypothetical protein HK102_001182, partial [Quaeritorhiza haematococci]
PASLHIQVMAAGFEIVARIDIKTQRTHSHTSASRQLDKEIIEYRNHLILSLRAIKMIRIKTIVFAIAALALAVCLVSSSFSYEAHARALTRRADGEAATPAVAAPPKSIVGRIVNTAVNMVTKALKGHKFTDEEKAKIGEKLEQIRAKSWELADSKKNAKEYAKELIQSTIEDEAAAATASNVDLLETQLSESELTKRYDHMDRFNDWSKKFEDNLEAIFIKIPIFMVMLSIRLVLEIPYMGVVFASRILDCILDGYRRVLEIPPPENSRCKDWDKQM